jgi:rhamnosyltransferase
MTLMKPIVSVIVRTFNEERWIAHSLNAIFTQEFDNLEVIIVDNNSTDFTLDIAKRFPIKKVVTIDKFLPGKALNDGIRQSSGEFIVCISAHCVPKDKYWLKNLHKHFEGNNKYAGVYGRQLPLSYTSDADKRDLLITFGQDQKIQVKDYFFHNANSMIPRKIWEEFPFEESATNIEDRIWGKSVIDAGFQIVYDPLATVYHHHGLHQHAKSSPRAKGIAKILNKIDKESIGDLPKSLKPENANFSVVLPVLGQHIVVDGINFLQRALDNLKEVKYINNIYVVTNDKSVKSIAEENDIQVIERPKYMQDPNIHLEEVLKYTLLRIEEFDDYPEAIVYVNYLYPFRPTNLIDELITELQYKGLDSVFSSFVDYGNYWKEDTNGDFTKVGDILEPRENKHPLHRALYGVGCVTLSHSIRKGNLTQGRIGILPLDNLLYALRLDKETPNEIILSAIKTFEKNKKNV